MALKQLGKSFKLLFFVFILLGLGLPGPGVLASPPSKANEKPGLTLAVYSATPDKTKRFELLAGYLSRELEHPVKILASQTFEQHVLRCKNGSADLFYLSPLAYAAVSESPPLPRLLAREAHWEVPFDFTRIVVRKDSHLVSMDQLRSVSFAFASRQSAMGYLVPRFVLYRSGITLKDFSSYAFLGSSRDAALGVLMGDFQAGAIREDTYRAYRERGLVSLVCSPPISSSLYAANRSMGHALARAHQGASDHHRTAGFHNGYPETDQGRPHRPGAGQGLRL